MKNKESQHRTIYPEVTYSLEEALSLERFKEMDYFSVQKFHIPIALLMENAGYHTAKVIANKVSTSEAILIGVGNGNNGGGGLVAARRLAAWGYTVYLDVFTPLTKPLVKAQYQRAIAVGVSAEKPKNIGLWLDAYLGFSQRLPLGASLLSRIEEANKSRAIRVSLDIPTGFLGNPENPHFKANTIVSLVAAKKLFYNLEDSVEILLADIGIPKKVFKQYNTTMPPFHSNGILKLIRQ